MNEAEATNFPQPVADENRRVACRRASIETFTDKRH